MVAVTGPAALAVGHGGSAASGNPTRSGCTHSAPRASIDNTWAWGSPGSWEMPRQQLTYAIGVFNKDVGSASSSFAVTVSPPNGFTVSRSSTITLNSASTGYVWAYVTSPLTVADGSYPLTGTVTRVGSASPPASSGTSSYKVYSSDTVAPSCTGRTRRTEGRSAAAPPTSGSHPVTTTRSSSSTSLSTASQRRRGCATASRTSASCRTSGRSAASTDSTRRPSGRPTRWGTSLPGR